MWCRCKLATLYLDGAVRCDFTMRLATQECDDMVGGLRKIFKPETIEPEKIKGRGGKPPATVKRPPSRGGGDKKKAQLPLGLFGS